MLEHNEIWEIIHAAEIDDSVTIADHREWSISFNTTKLSEAQNTQPQHKIVDIKPISEMASCQIWQ